MKDITVIIPLHKFDETIKPLLERAIKSIPKDLLVSISCGVNVNEKELYYLNDIFEGIEITVPIEKDEKDDFCTLVNRKVEEIGTKWFTILEFDDIYTDIWFKNVDEYMKYYPETTVFLPLEEITDFNSNKFISYGNEAPWATSFSNEEGVIDNDCLQQFFDFYLTGGIFNTSDWLECGGLKPSIKLTFWYEFLLRITNMNKRVFVIPKLGYKHFVNRKESLISQYQETITEEESEKWFELAKQECLFKEDRNKTYEENNEKGE